MIRKSFFLTLLLVGAALLAAGCSGNIMVKMDYDAVGGAGSPLASSPPAKVKVLDFEDQREGSPKATIVGRRATKSKVLGDVVSWTPVTEIVRKAVRDELFNSGHAIVGENEGVIVRGKINKLWVSIDVTSLHQDVTAEIEIEVEAVVPGNGELTVRGRYSASHMERISLKPSGDTVKRVLDKSLQEVIHLMRADTKLSDGIRESTQ